jgi:D-glycero-D-manno-heptose 1,7-bisphosphate phosphatase
VDGAGAGRVTSQPARQAILLDRDGVLVEPVPDPLTGTFESPLHPADVRLVDRAAEALALLIVRRVPLFVCSNQPAAAKGTVAMSELEAVHRRTVELLAADGVTLDGWTYCFHHPDGVVPELTGACDCRKPNAGMLTETLAARSFDPARCWMVGDADTDVIAGRRAGTRTALLEHPLTAHRRATAAEIPRSGASRASAADAVPDVRVRDLLEFAGRLFPTAATG